MGRYLLIASSGRRASLPAHLQGVWAPNTKPPWGSDYHLNINLQMAYWPAGPTGLLDCYGPLQPLLSRLSQRGAQAAKHLYGVDAEGAWMAHGFTDAWASAAPLASPMWAHCVSCGAWAALQLWQRYEFSIESDDLRGAWQLLKGAALFFEGALLRRHAHARGRDGPLRWGPSHSPENAYAGANGTVHYLAYDVALDLSVIWHVAEALQSGEPLVPGRSPAEEEDDAALVARFSKLVQRLATAGTPAVDDNGELIEWGGAPTGDAPTTSRRPVQSADEGHRHFSHLFPLYPGAQIDPAAPAHAPLRAAARRSLVRRLRRGGGHTGWSAAWAASLWARLLDGSLAHASLRHTLHEFASPSLLGLHPKLKGKPADGPQGMRCATCFERAGGAGEGVFQMDANAGFTAAAAEMLLQSHSKHCAVHILPALPPAWRAGEVRGLRARRALRVDLTWSAAKLRSLEITRLRGDAGVVSVCCAQRFAVQTARRSHALPASSPWPLCPLSASMGEPQGRPAPCFGLGTCPYPPRGHCSSPVHDYT